MMFAEAKEAFIAGNYAMAETLFAQLLLQNSRNPEIYQMLGTIYYDKGQFNKAIRAFQRALEIDPTYTDASVGLSIILNDLGRYDEGKKVFNDAKKLLDQKNQQSDPHLEERIANKHEELADLYLQCHRYNDSLDQLLKALKLSTRKTELTLRVADCYVKLGESQKAVRELRGLIRDYPNSIPARMKLGIILYNMQNLAEATEQWENILVRDPKHPEAAKYLKMAQAAGITTLTY